MEEISDKLSVKKDIMEPPSVETMKHVYEYIVSTILPKVVPTYITDKHNKE